MWRLALALSALPQALSAGIIGANYTAPTERYDHGILGDAVEWGALEMRTEDGRTLRLTLPQSRVFEDIAPRLADLDGDGDMEVITVETVIEKGGTIAIYDETGLVAATRPIGQTHRWVAPVGAGDLDGDGRVEIAYVDRPHLAREIVVVRLEGRRLVEVARARGFTNHQIGDAVISGGIRRCAAHDEAVVASPDWTRALAVRLDGARILARDIGALPSDRSFDAAMSCNR